MSDPRIHVFVVVEDEPDMRTLVRLMLGRDPRVEVVGEAASAKEALALLDRFQPGLIVLDHGIEGDIMGLQAAPLLRARAPAAKILLFTAYDMHREAMAEPAIDAYLRKDRINDLLPTALRLLGVDHARPA